MATNPENYQHFTKKVPSTGKKWMERRKHEAEMKSYDERKENEIFGSNILSDYDYIASGKPNTSRRKNKKEGVEDGYSFADYQQRQYERKQEDLEDSMHLAQAKLSYLARNKPRVVEIFLLDFLKQANLKKIHARLNAEDRKGLATGIVAEAIWGKKIDHADEYAKIIARKMQKGELFFSENELIDALRIHQKKVLEAEQAMTADFITFRKRIKKLLIEASEKGKIPVSKKVITERLSAMSFYAVDSMVASLENIGGDFTPQGHQIRIASDLSPQSRWQVFVHEVMHALSGQTEYLSEWKIEDSEPDPYYTPPGVPIKIGLQFFDTEKYEKKGSRKIKPRLRWLNEALTETMTAEISGKNTSYKTEQELLRLLIQSGIPMDVFTSAYFENYRSKAPAGEHKLPQTKRIFELTNQKFGQGFLMKLDEYIIASGAKTAVEKWKELGDDFPPFIMENGKEKRQPV